MTQSDVALGEPIVHVHPKCGEVAVRFAPGRERPEQYDVRNESMYFTHADGRPIVSGEFRKCDACGRYIGIQPDWAGGPWKAVS